MQAKWDALKRISKKTTGIWVSAVSVIYFVVWFNEGLFCVLLFWHCLPFHSVLVQCLDPVVCNQALFLQSALRDKNRPFTQMNLSTKIKTKTQIRKSNTLTFNNTHLNVMLKFSKKIVNTGVKQGSVQPIGKANKIPTKSKLYSSIKAQITPASNILLLHVS